MINNLYKSGIHWAMIFENEVVCAYCKGKGEHPRRIEGVKG